MQLHRPLGVLTPTLDGDVLGVLAAATTSFTGRQIARLLPDHSQSGVQNVLRRLVQQGIVTLTAAGSAHLYSLNRDHLAAAYVIGLRRLQDQFRQRLSTLVSEWPVPAEVVIVFGSAARGTMEPDSDIDLFVVRPPSVDDDLWAEQTAVLTERVSAWTGNQARIVEMTAAEARDGLVHGDGLLLAIRDEGDVVVGDPRYLHRLERARMGAL